MAHVSVLIMDKDAAVGNWLRAQLGQINIEARWVATLSDLLAEAEKQPPVVCLFALRPPVSRALTLITALTQEPRFASTAFILMGSVHDKRAAFEAGADDYLITPPDVIELRKRVRLYLDRALLEARVVAETRITQEMEALSKMFSPSDSGEAFEPEALTLLEHAAALTQEHNLLDTVLRATSQAVAFVDPDGILLFTNPAWESLIGQKRGLTVGDHMNWPPTAVSPSDSQAISSAIAEQRSWQGDIRCQLADGDQQDLAMTINPAFDASGELMGYVMTYLDIAERKALEAVRTRFLMNAATEIRTPVTNLKMRHYLLQESPAEQRPMHLQALAREIERLSRLVEAMFELARLDAGLTSITLERIDLKRLVAEAVTRFNSAAAEKGVTLASEENDKLKELLCADPAHLARALGILIDNAIQHTPEAGHIQVRLAREVWSGGAFVTIQVQDTGIGIEPNAIPFVFDRFFRGERARANAIRGVGLGLAIAKEIVSRHDGHISVESEINQGSTFTIWLPCPP